MKTYRTTKVILADSGNKFLILTRSDTHPTQAHNADLPGGVVEDGEEPTLGLCREIREETGLAVEPTQLALVYSETEEHSGMNAVRLVYYATLPDAEPTIILSYEHESYVWAPAADCLVHFRTESYKQRALRYILDHQLVQDL